MLIKPPTNAACFTFFNFEFFSPSTSFFFLVLHLFFVCQVFILSLVYVHTAPPQTRCKQAERERDLALEANRLFKQDFGDKIESLQVEAEQLRRQR